MFDNMPFETRDQQNLKRIYESPSLLLLEQLVRVNSIGKAYIIEKFRHKNLIFQFVRNTEGELIKLKVSGSIHKYWNNGLHNANQFTFEDFNEAVRMLENQFELDLDKMFLQPPEYGVNLINTPEIFDGIYLSNQDLISNTMCINRSMYSNQLSHVRSSKIAGSRDGDFKSKFYCKTTEQALFVDNHEVFRSEIVYRRNRSYYNKGIKTLKDLIAINNHKFFIRKHLDQISQMVIYDPTIYLNKRHREYNKTLKYSNPLYWVETPDIVYHPRRVKVTIAGRTKVTHPRRAKVTHL
ncbi:hypothetical protein PY092_06310 [Muricauda sp. 334s03]|uniref:Uncharacterized protein n=1 Tax=Flagellimonas yonaguniensis TaxID=3031325 RepID=A0ABT5XXE3_9FLAO|nr:hypothetical protein [[Muricauda] yonaguniensis]MDF0715753.1 hypothetical protein [[Muricauda] yonaguniensis]